GGGRVPHRKRRGERKLEVRVETLRHRQRQTAAAEDPFPRAHELEMRNEGELAGLREVKPEADSQREARRQGGSARAPAVAGPRQSRRPPWPARFDLGSTAGGRQAIRAIVDAAGMAEGEPAIHGDLRAARLVALLQEEG